MGDSSAAAATASGASGGGTGATAVAEEASSPSPTAAADAATAAAADAALKTAEREGNMEHLERLLGAAVDDCYVAMEILGDRSTDPRTWDHIAEEVIT